MVALCESSFGSTSLWVGWACHWSYLSSTLLFLPAHRYSMHSTLRVSDTVIRRGAARFRGGGAFVYQGSATFARVRFDATLTTFAQFVPFFTSGGGAVYVVSVHPCRAWALHMSVNVVPCRLAGPVLVS